MKLRNQKLRYNMQFFASKGEDGDGTDKAGDDGDDNQDDADQVDKGTDGKGKKSDKAKGKMYTQEEIDDMISDRLKRERKKAEKKQEQTKDQTKDDKQGDKGSDDKSKVTDDKVSALEAKLLCFEHDVSKDCVPDVVALAKAYVDEDTDFEDAIKKVIKKYPQFVKGAGKKKDADDEDEDEDDTDNQKGSWGQRQKSSSKKSDGVEAAFLKKNPGLKID